MSKPIPNKIRCKHCKHFVKQGVGIGICFLHSYKGVIFVRPNQQIKNCFVKGGAQE